MPFPTPPEIANVELVEAGNVTISANITTHTQKTVDISDPLSLITNPDISPNPPGVDFVRLYYFFNGAAASRQYKTMQYNSSTGKWEATIPFSEFSTGDTMTYFITAADTAGNIASEIPGLLPASGVTLDTWNSDLSTPQTTACGFGQRHPTLPASSPGTLSCGANDSVNDDSDDIGILHLNRCLIPNTNNAPELTGFSASVSGDEIFVRARLGAIINPTGWMGFTDGYFAYFLNPDDPDSTPSDMHIENAYAMWRYPSLASVDQSYAYTRIMDIDCLSLKYMESIAIFQSEEEFNDCVSYPEYYWQTTSDGTGNTTWSRENPYVFFKIDRNLVFGSQTNSVIIFILSQALPYPPYEESIWYPDTTTGMRIYAVSREYTF